MQETCKSRQQRVSELFPKDIDTLLVTNLSNVRYLSGFAGSCGTLLLNAGKTVFFTDFRYQEQAEQQVGKSAKIVVYKKGPMEAVLEYLKKNSVQGLGFEGSIDYASYDALRSGFKKPLKNVSGLPEKIRRRKDAYEIAQLKKAFSISDRCFEKLLKFLKPGRKEIDVAAKLEYLMRKSGSDGPSFDTIIASGERASCPHAHPTSKKIATGEMVKIDFGAIFNGYHSDMTRTVFLGKADSKFKEIYRIVLKAQELAIKALKPGIRCFDIDAIARDFIKGKGYGDNFGHGLGHPLGLDIHESPGLSFKTKKEEIVEEGMVVTIEPGIYIPGWGGVRIEDVFLVTSDGVERLTRTSNSLLEIL